MINNKLENYISTLNQYAEFADKIGDFESADRCVELLKEAENYNNSNIKTAMERTAFFKKIFRGIKNIGKGIDKFVRKNLGGWTTIAAIAAAPYLAKLAPQLKGIGSQVVNAIKAGKNPMELLQSKNPLVAKIAGDFLNNMKSQAGAAGGQAIDTGQGQPGQGQPTSFTFGQGFVPTTGAQGQPQSATVLTNPQGLLIQFRNDSVSRLMNTKNQTEAQAIFNQIKRDGVTNLSNRMKSTTNPQPEELNLINPMLETIKSMAKANRGYNLQ